MSSDPDASPFNPLPPVVVALALVIFVIELIFEAGTRGFLGGATAVGWRLDAVQSYGFFTIVLETMIERGAWPLEQVARFVTYPFIHWSFTHMIMVIVFLLALGNLVGRVFSAWAVLVIFFGSAIFGALIYAGVTGSPEPLVGGYPAVYGLIGAYTFILWVRLGQEGAPQSRAFTLIAVLLGIQLVFGLLFGSRPDWVADLGGFGTGFFLSFVVSPGGWTRVLQKLRSR